MADISTELAAILAAVYGEDVRGSIHDAIEKINDVSEVVLSTGTAVSSASSSSTGFYEDSLYLNTNTYELWKCAGTDTWSSLGVLKGDDGDPGTPGADGADGNVWYIGTSISGKYVNPTVYSGSGITDAHANDCYLNNSEGAVYHCTLGGDASTATWVYDFTMTGGGGGSSYTGGTGITISNANVISIDPGSIASGVQKPVTGDAVNTALASKADSTAIHDATLTIQQNGVSKGTFTANASSNVTANIVTDGWTSGVTAQTVGDDVVAVFDDLDNSFGYDLYCLDEFITYTDVVKGTGTNSGIKLTYTLDGATSGVSTLYLRILK